MTRHSSLGTRSIRWTAIASAWASGIALGAFAAPALSRPATIRGDDHKKIDEAVIMSVKAPIAEIMHCPLAFAGVHLLKELPEVSQVAYHFCKPLNADVNQCVLYDGTGPNARLIGIEYLVSDSIYQKMPAEEKNYWHDHRNEVDAGLLHSLVETGAESARPWRKFGRSGARLTIRGSPARPIPSAPAAVLGRDGGRTVCALPQGGHSQRTSAGTESVIARAEPFLRNVLIRGRRASRDRRPFAGLAEISSDFGVPDSLRLSRPCRTPCAGGLGETVRAAALGDDVPPRERPMRLRMICEDLGPTFVKLGQILSTRPDILPEAYTTELAKLRDAVKPFPFSEVEAILVEEFGRSPSELFATINPVPVAAASISQVHSALTQRSRDRLESPPAGD